MTTYTEIEIAPKTRAKDVIGSSEVAAIVGLDPRCSPFELAARKKGLADRPATSYMTRGKRFEQVVAQVWAEEHSKQIEWMDRAVPAREGWLVASPDFAVVEKDRREGGEVKTVNPFMAHEWGEPGTDDIPIAYIPQVQITMRVMGWKRMNVAAFFHRDRIDSYVVQADPELQETLIQRAADFRDKYLVTDELPPITVPGELVDAYIKTKFPSAHDPARPATAEEAALAEQLIAARAALKAAEENEGRLMAATKLAIGPCEAIFGDFGRISWKEVKGREKIDWAAIVRDCAIDESVIKEHTSTGMGYRRFMVTTRKGGAK